MAAIQKLTDRKIQSLKEPGKYSDGGGLYLVVTKTGTKNWLFMYRMGDKRREMGLGSAEARQVGLQAARDAAEKARALVRKGIDPINRRSAQRDAQKTLLTFGDAADRYIEAKSAEWRNDKHLAQWKMTMQVYAKKLRPLPVRDIATEHVLEALRPIWTAKPETASRVRNRIELILDAAKASGDREGENPARWRGHLDKLLPKRQKLSRGHHAAMPYGDVPAFVAALREADTISARALEFLILTAARSGEVFGAKWPEIDMDAKIWTVPAERMKAGKEHRVPLCDRAIAILKASWTIRDADDGFVFTGKGRKDAERKGLSNMAMDMQMRRLGYEQYTVHGFRSAFRDWCYERTNFQTELAEQALAHTLSNKVEAAYRRADALERRRELMNAWGAHCEPSKDGKVISIHSKGAA